MTERRSALRSFLVVGGLLAAPAALRAGPPGTIDTADATFTTGEAAVRGAVVVDPAANLGTAPDVRADADPLDDSAFPQYWWSSPIEPVLVQGGNRGLGGPDVVFDRDLTLPGGVHDFGEIVIERGVTVTVTGPATIRTTGDVLVEGRLVMEGAGVLGIDCRGRATFVGHEDGGGSGIFADDADASVLVFAGRDIESRADEGAEFTFSATGDWGRVTLASDFGDVRLEHARIASGPWRIESLQTSSVQVTRGDAFLESCTVTGARLAVQARYGWHFDINEGRGGQVTLRGGSFRDTWLIGQTGILVAGSTITADDRVQLFDWGQVGVRVTEGAQITANRGLAVTAETAVEIGADVALTLTGDPSPYPWDNNSPYLLVQSNRRGVSVADGATIDNRSSAPVLLWAGESVTLAGTLRSAGLKVGLSSQSGDVELAGSAVLDTPSASVILWAGGAIFAQGGEARLSAPEYDIRCITGDLDLDVASMEATAGRIVALSKGLVRLRGEFRAARDIQVLSTLDSVDVRGANFVTADVGQSLSGFIRLATYAPSSVVLPVPADGEDDWSDEEDEGDEEDDEDYAKANRSFVDPDEPVTLDASNASLRTGASDARSGDVLIQVAESSGAATRVALKVGRAKARALADGSVVTDVTGTLTFRGPKPNLQGSMRVTAGSVSRRVYLGGSEATATSDAGTISVKVVQRAARRATVTIRLTEPSARPAGTRARLGIDRAGLHARTMFRRPAAKKR